MRSGGSYIIENGKRVLKEAPTKDHPQGNRARDKVGGPVAPAAKTAPAPAKTTKE